MARILEVGDFGAEPILLDLGAQHVLQRDLAHFVLSASELLEVCQQAKVFLVDADFLRQEVKLIVGALHLKSARENSRLKREVFGLAFRRGNLRRHPEFVRPGDGPHEAGHDRSDDVLNVHLEGELRVGERPRLRDAFDGCAPVVVSGFDLRLVEQRASEIIAETGRRREDRQLGLLRLRTIRRGDELSLTARFFFPLGRDPFATCKERGQGKSAKSTRDAIRSETIHILHRLWLLRRGARFPAGNLKRL